jgi:hypothetical protein
MATATAETTQEQGQKVRFGSKYQGLILTRVQERTVFDGFGRPRPQNQDEWIREQEAKNDEREARGVDPLPIDRSPWKVEFDGNGMFETEDPILIDFLRGHDNFGMDRPSGFHEIPPTDDELKPTPSEQRKAIARASAERDVDALAEIRKQEEDTHNRPEIVELAVASIEAFAERPPESGADAETGESPSSSGS